MSRENEVSPLMPESQNTFFSNFYQSIPLIYDSVNKYLFSLIDSIGGMQGLCSTYSLIAKCNDANDEDCALRVERNAFYIALGITYAKILTKALKLFFKSKSFKSQCDPTKLDEYNQYVDWFKKFDQGIDISIDTIGSHTFFLVCGASIAAAVAKSPTIESLTPWQAIVFPAIVLSVLLFPSHPDFQDCLKRHCSSDGSFSQLRGAALRAYNFMAGFFEGSACAISAIVGIEESIVDSNKLSHRIPGSYVSPAWAIGLRYSLGIVYGVIAGVLRLCYSTENGFLESRWPRITLSIIETIAFFILTLQICLETSQSPTYHIVFMAPLLIGLAILGLSCAVGNIIQKWGSKQNSADHANDFSQNNKGNIQNIDDSDDEPNFNSKDEASAIPWNRNGNSEVDDIYVNRESDLEKETSSVNIKSAIQTVQNEKNLKVKDITKDITKKVLTFFKSEPGVKSNEIREYSAQIGVVPGV